jgi:hypothetical protein
MAVVACAYGVVAHGSPWLPINLLAGMALPSLDHAQAGELRAFHATAFALACVLHAGLSLLVGLVYAAILPMLPGRPLLWGGIVAPLAWTAVAWSTLGIVNPALEQHVSWPWFIASQIAFGLAAGFAIARIEPIRTLQSQPLMVRAGIEGAGGASEREEHERCSVGPCGSLRCWPAVGCSSAASACRAAPTRRTATGVRRRSGISRPSTPSSVRAVTAPTGAWGPRGRWPIPSTSHSSTWTGCARS